MHGSARAKMLTTGAALVVAAISATPASAAGEGGNVDCKSGFTALKYDGMPTQGQGITDGVYTATVLSVNYKADDRAEAYGFTISDNGFVDYVIVKAGPVATVYGTAQDEIVNDTRSDDLNARLGPGGRHYAISNFVICYK